MDDQALLQEILRQRQGGGNPQDIFNFATQNMQQRAAQEQQAGGTWQNGSFIRSGGQGGQLSDMDLEKMGSTPKEWTSGNGLEDFAVNNLPAIGGTIGGIGAGLLGIESGPGALLTGMAGAGAGSAIGETAKRMIKGEDLTPSEIATQGVEGAGGELLGAGLGKIGGSLLGKVGSTFSGAAAGAAGNVLKKDLTKQGFDLIPKAVRENSGLVDVAQHFQDLGIKATPENFGRLHDTVIGTLSPALKDAAAKADSFAADGLSEKVLGSLGDIGASKEATFTKNLGSNLEKATNEDGTIDPSKAFDLIKTSDSRAAALRTGASKGDVDAQALQRGHQALSGELQNRLYNDTFTHPTTGATLPGGGMDSIAVDGKLLGPEQIAALQQESPKLAEGAMGIHTAADGRSFQAPFVDAGKLADAHGKVVSGDIKPWEFGGGMPASVMSTAEKVPGAVINAAPVQNAAAKGLGLAGKIGDLAQGNMGNILFGRAGEQAATAPALNLVGRVEGQRFAHPNLPDSQAAAAAAQAAQGGQAGQPKVPGAGGVTDFSSPGAAMPGADAMGGAMGATDAGQTATGYSESDLKNALANDIATTGGKNLSKIEALMRMNQTYAKSAGAGGKISPLQQQGYATLGNAQDALATVSAAFDQAGGAKGPLQGNIDRLLEMPSGGGAVAGYDQTKKALADRISTALALGKARGVQQMSAKDVEQGLPNTTDSPYVAQMKLKQWQLTLMKMNSIVANMPSTNSNQIDLSQFTSPQQVDMSAQPTY